ncbi:hypothetical protein BEWA_000990 [Theileria equi strain WA]|uniref:Uncharacterized protein n=1 Tax=Theileria equi strain WA TaxID=1537102 RepID=L0AYM1_THEEQ|nr:hypothetical protein BEWA_000990 [Theileria equi strain WA]AFZ80692.1 hypothetical protein BEWA_000990 [Theileria equi strain WA]|eukprot:XP_004830358.1 hypothetical protein BEWA_000990 [Theileria equi strain WA]
MPPVFFKPPLPVNHKAPKGRIVPLTKPDIRLGKCLVTLTPRRIKAEALEKVRLALRRVLKKRCERIVDVHATYPVTKKPDGVKMGQGKGKIDHYVARVPADIKHKCQPRNKKRGKGIDTKEPVPSMICGILSLTYDNHDLTDANDGSINLAKKHNIKELSTYYHKTYDSNNDIIRKPLILKIQDEGGENHWYSNADADKNEQDENEWYKGKPNTRWKLIQSEDDFPTHYPWKGGSKFTKKLNDLTCELHNLHYVDISRDEKLATYHSCSVCSNYSVTVTKENSNVEGYTKYKHEYTTNANSIKYGNTLLKLKDEGVEDEEIPLDSDKIRQLFVHYWEKDTEHTKPLFMEVYVKGFDTTVPVSNNGEKGNSKWTMIEEAGPVSAEMLHQQRCVVYKPVDINISEQAGYPNSYCKIKHGKCLNDRCNGRINVEPYNKYKIPDEYSAYRHIHNTRELLTITGFKNGDRLDEKKPPIWDVKEVIVFFPKCEKNLSDNTTETPLLIYVSSNNEDGATHKWYSRTKGDKGGIEWKVENGLGTNPPDKAFEDGNLLVTTLNRIRGDLELKCPEDIKRELEEQEKAIKEKEAEEKRNKEIAALKAKECTIGELFKALGDDIAPVLGTSVVASVAGLYGTTVALELVKDLIPTSVAQLGSGKDSRDSGHQEYKQLQSRADSDENGGGVPGPEDQEAPPPLPTSTEAKAEDSTAFEVIPDAPSATYSRMVFEEHGNTMKHTMYGNFVKEYHNTMKDIRGYGSDVETYEAAPEVTVPIDVSVLPEAHQAEEAASGKPGSTDIHAEGGEDTRAEKLAGQDAGDYQTEVTQETKSEDTPQSNVSSEPAPPAEAQPFTGASAAKFGGAGEAHISAHKALDLSPPVTLPLSPPNSNQDIIETTISVTTGVLGTSALACFAGWKLYNRYKGDPLVRNLLLRSTTIDKMLIRIMYMDHKIPSKHEYIGYPIIRLPQLSPFLPGERPIFIALERVVANLPISCSFRSQNNHFKVDDPKKAAKDKLERDLEKKRELLRERFSMNIRA